MDLFVGPDGGALWGERRLRCAIGRAGVARDKREGDGATPIGCFPMRRVLYRADRMMPPPTALPALALAPDDGWCDDAGDAMYNRQVRLPRAGRHEALWREDALYDLIVVLGHNDDPPAPGAGSAVFLHVAEGDYRPTAGCVALALEDLRRVLAGAAPGDRVCVGSS